jgi:hypothetical protein
MLYPIYSYRLSTKLPDYKRRWTAHNPASDIPYAGLIGETKIRRNFL